MAQREDTSLLQAALVGYQEQLSAIQAKMAEIRKRLGGAAGHSAHLRDGVNRAQHKKHRISPEGRARIAEAQRRRWAAAKKKERTS